MKYLIKNSGPPKLVRCDVLVEKESRKIQESDNFQRGECSLGLKEDFGKFLAIIPGVLVEVCRFFQ